jgi:hypothetical protein
MPNSNQSEQLEQLEQFEQLEQLEQPNTNFEQIEQFEQSNTNFDQLEQLEQPNLSNLIITQLTTNQTIVNSGIQITNQQGLSNDGKEFTQTIFTTTDPTFDPQITEHLLETVEFVNSTVSDECVNTESELLLAEIKNYASQINCSNFHGKGSIDDYTELFKTASNIANESKQMTLNVDVDGFNEFGNAADELSKLFNGFILKLQNVSIISDINFLKSISDSLKKIVNLSNVFGKFKETILLTSTIQIPKSTHETKIVLENVMTELNCAINYINYFADPTLYENTLPNAKLSDDEQNAINKAIDAIENWSKLSEQGVSIAMSNNLDVQYINQSNANIKNKTNNLKNITNQLKQKLNI